MHHSDDKLFAVKRLHLLPLTFFSSMGCTLSTAHRLEKRRALQLLPFDDKFGALIWRRCCFNFGRASLKTLETLESLETLRSARAILRALARRHLLSFAFLRAKLCKKNRVIKDV